MTETTITMTFCCFYCGGNQNMQPAYMARPGECWSRVVMKEPCSGCQMLMSTGITIFETTETDHGCDAPQPKEGVFLTGRWVLVHPKQVAKLFSPDTTSHLVERGMGFLTTEQYKDLGMAQHVEAHH